MQYFDINAMFISKYLKGHLESLLCQCSAFNIVFIFVQGEPGSPGMGGLPGSPGRGVPGTKVISSSRHVHCIVFTGAVKPGDKHC